MGQFVLGQRQRPLPALRRHHPVAVGLQLQAQGQQDVAVIIDQQDQRDNRDTHRGKPSATPFSASWLGAVGRVKKKVLPPPGWLSTQSEPPIPST